jgi:hypothetical protein
MTGEEETRQLIKSILQNEFDENDAILSAIPNLPLFVLPHCNNHCKEQLIRV